MLFTRDGRRVISVGEGEIHLWNADTGKEIQQIAQVGTVECLAVSPDGLHAATLTSGLSNFGACRTMVRQR